MRPLRIVVAAIGWTGHLFPALGLATALRDRGHEVVIETFERWREVVGSLGHGFRAAPERITFPGVAAEPGAPSLTEAARESAAALRALGPDAVVCDLFTLAPALGAETEGLPCATLIPHPFPAHDRDLPYYTLGLVPARTPVARLAWRTLWPAAGTRLPNTRLREVRATLDRARAELGLGPSSGYDGQISEQLAMVATYPQLEYPRRWPAHVHITGPMIFELPHPEIDLPPGDDPLVLVASSTERDPELRLIRAALAALASDPVRVVATINRKGSRFEGAVPANAMVVDWLSYAQLMPRAALVVCHGGHGTITRALSAGAPVLVSPPAGDMAETGARVTWAGAGLMVPNRLLGAGSLRLAVARILDRPSFAARARELAAWSARHDGAATGADLVERWAVSS
jgi:UDP:flavonoid glycosyltransferase YjiC (YdhE family)